MAVSAQFQQFVLDQLSAVQPVRSRRMFSGAGFYAGELFFAIAHNDTLYFKVDATTRPEFAREGMHAFQPGGPDGLAMNGYFELPPRLYEDSDELARWMRAAIAVAARAAPLRKPRRTAAPPRKSAALRTRPRTSRGPSRAR
jgi:DNA transformation protein and related proteins